MPYKVGDPVIFVDHDFIRRELIGIPGVLVSTNPLRVRITQPVRTGFRTVNEAGETISTREEHIKLHIIHSNHVSQRKER